MAYVKYVWVGNRISFEDMAAMYRIKQKTRIPITKLVAAAVSEYVRKLNTSKNIEDGKGVVESGSTNN